MDNEAPDRSSSKVDGADEAELLLKKIAEARDQALRMKLTLTARLLDMACLDLTSASNNRK
jgi:hypothetical protein